MKSIIRSLTIDCANPQRLADFWAAVFGFEIVRLPDEALRVADPSGVGPLLTFQIVPEGKVVKNRLHFDLTPDTTQQAEVERLVRLGAKVSQKFNEPGEFGDFTLMQDPEGNEFCVENSLSERKQP